MKHIKFIAVVMLCVISVSNIADAEYLFSESRKETPQDFTNFLESCTNEERVMLLQALKDFPDLKDEYFGNLKGLPELDKFAEDKNKETKDLPAKPSTFNEVLPVTVLDAVSKGVIPPEKISVHNIRKAIIWRAYNKLTYPLRSEADYHEIVKWAAEKSNVSSEHVKALPTYMLEKKVAEKYFEDLWEKLNPEQRAELLKNMEKETGVNFDADTISLMGGAAAFTAIQGAIIAYGLPVIVMDVLTWLLSSNWLIAYFVFPTTIPIMTGSSMLAWILTGPIGMTITGGLAVGGAFMLGRAEKETVSAFILTVHMIKAKKFVTQETNQSPAK